MKNSPVLSEDTQPHAPDWDDTQPTSAMARSRPSRQRGRWLLLSIIVVTSCTLAITLTFLLRSLPEYATSEISFNKQITLIRDGSTLVVETTVETVAEFLREAQIELPPNVSLSHDSNDSLSDGMTITLMRSRDVTIEFDEDQRTVGTFLDNPLQILESAGIEVSSNDKIWVNGALARFDALPGWTIPAQHIKIRRPLRLTIVDAGEASEIMSTADTVADALLDAGITLHASDIVTPPLDSLIGADAPITIRRALPITLKVDGVVIEARSNARRVDALLEELDVALFGLDFVIPAGDSEVSKDMQIEIVRVTEEVIAHSEIIPSGFRYEANASMSLDEKAVVQLGQEGTKEVRSSVRYENGVEASRVVTETVITVEPQDHVVQYGTNIVLRSVDTPEGPRRYWRKLCMLATSYHPAVLGGDDTTSIGWKLAKGIVASDPKIIRYRTEVFVPGYGVGTMADTGGPRSSPYWIDLGYSDEDWKSWRRYVNVYLLEPAPSEIDYLLPAWTANRNYAGSCGS